MGRYSVAQSGVTTDCSRGWFDKFIKRMETIVVSNSRISPEERFRKLLTSILDMTGNSRTLEWMNQRLQAIVDEVDPLRRPRDFWEKRFPGKGETIMALLEPFYDPGLSFELKSPAFDLETRCRQAIFWRDITGVKVMNEARFKGSHLRDSFRDSFRGSLGDSFRDSFRGSLRSSLWGSLTISLWGSLWGSLRNSLQDSLGGSFRDSLTISLWGSLRSSLFFACGFAIVGDQKRDFQPLLKLWRSGNLPIGFDKEGNLLVLCATSMS